MPVAVFTIPWCRPNLFSLRKELKRKFTFYKVEFDYLFSVLFYEKKVDEHFRYRTFHLQTKEVMVVKRVITYGTYDLFHWGHQRLLERAKELGDYLIVGLSTDEFNMQKNKKSVHSYQKRKQMLESLDLVDEIIPEKNWEQKIEDVKKHRVDIFVMGDDWKGKFDYLNDFCKVIYLPRTEGISTTQIKKEMLDRNGFKSDN
jgi:glycerol-3-phosphate cytidylyltransferase